MHTISVFLAIDHPLVRQGLLQACTAQPDVTVVGEARSGDEARRLIPAARPDVVVHHALLPFGSEPRFLTDMYGPNKPWRCVMLVPIKDYEMMSAAMAAPADAWLLTNDLPQHVIRTIRDVSHGGRFACPLLEASMRYQRDGTRPAALSKLEERDLAVFYLINSSMTKAAVARELGMSPSAVGASRLRICETLHAANNREVHPAKRAILPETPFPADDV
jgi:two-component system response regulator DevR